MIYLVADESETLSTSQIAKQPITRDLDRDIDIEDGRRADSPAKPNAFGVNRGGRTPKVSGTAPLRGRAGLELMLPSVDGHPQAHAPTATPPNLAALNGAAISGGSSPDSEAASTSAVIGASKIP